MARSKKKKWKSRIKKALKLAAIGAALVISGATFNFLGSCLIPHVTASLKNLLAIIFFLRL